MVINSNIPLMGQMPDFTAAAEQGLQSGNGFAQMIIGSQINRMRDIDNADERKAFANNNIFGRQLRAQIKLDDAAALKAANDQLKFNAELAKTGAETGKLGSEAFKNNAQGQGYKLENAGKVGAATQKALSFAAKSGDKNAAFHGLDLALNTGEITPEAHAQARSVLLSLNDKDKVKEFAMSMLDPKYNFQTVDNAETNAVSVANNVRTTNASMYSTDKAAETAEKKLSFEQARLEFEQKKGIVQQFGDNMYMVYPNGDAVPISSPTGQPVTKVNPTTKNSIAEERQRTQKVSVTLDAIEGLLDDATGSGIGRLVDAGARLFGAATKGDVATAQLGTLGGQLVALMPKMSGPQSDKDVEMYKQMAGKLDDPSIPIEIRKAALSTIRELNDKYSEMNEAQGQGIPYAKAKSANSRPPVASFFQ